jgi:hypothetical protein
VKDDNGLIIPGTEGDTWEDNPYDPEEETIYVRCLLCGTEVEKHEWGDCGHHYKMHAIGADERSSDMPECQVEGCDCTQMYWQDTP